MCKFLIFNQVFLAVELKKIELWFNDTSVLSDVIGNKVSEGKIVGNLNYFEYIPPGKKCFN